MTKRKPPSAFAIKRGQLMLRAREKAEWSQALVAKKLGLKSREVVSMYESGRIEEISAKTCRAIVLHLGLLPKDVAEDPTVFQLDDLPHVSDEARRVARRWDAIPEDVRQLILKTIEATAPADTPEKKG